MTGNRFCVIENTAFLLEVCPTAGSSVTRFAQKRADGSQIELFRPFTGDRSGTIDPFACGCVTMLPYTNRISDGVLHYKGKAYAGLPLHGAEPNALHGDGKDSVWEVTEHTASRLTVTLDKGHSEAPYHYRARQTYELQEDGLVIAMHMINLGDELPFAAGQHPYFPVTEGTLITADLPLMELCDRDMRFVAIVPTPPECDFSTGRRISDFPDLQKGFGGHDRLDNAFLGQGDKGWVTQPEDGIKIAITASPVTISADDGQTLATRDSTATTIYIPPYDPIDPQKNYVCFEPGMANIVDEFNLHERGVTHRPLPVLRQGDMYDIEIRYSMTSLA